MSGNLSKMPGHCVVGGCSNTASLGNCIALHSIHFYRDTRPEAKKQRKRWIDFLKMKRGKWEPSKGSVICSRHFQLTDFERRFNFLPGQSLQFPRTYFFVEKFKCQGRSVEKKILQRVFHTSCMVA